MTYRGHSVVSTLIRCHWSPLSTTGQRYLYTGSADGKFHIYSLDGRIVETIDRSKTHPLLNRKTGEYNDPSDWNLRAKPNKSRKGGYGGYGGGVTVREVWKVVLRYINGVAREGRDWRILSRGGELKLLLKRTESVVSISGVSQLLSINFYCVHIAFSLSLVSVCRISL